MSLIKYYDALFENEKLNSEYVTYLSAIHMMNTISKRDNINNKILKDLGMKDIPVYLDDVSGYDVNATVSDPDNFEIDSTNGGIGSYLLYVASH